MTLYDLRERLYYMLKNRTDGFAATSLEPRDSGLPAYIIFNCYGSERRFINPIKHRKMIVEIALDSRTDVLYRRFDLGKTIPVEVTESPKILLRGRKLKQAQSLFCQQGWNDIFCFIARNRYTIKQHWIGESGSLELLNAIK